MIFSAPVGVPPESTFDDNPVAPVDTGNSATTPELSATHNSCCDGSTTTTRSEAATPNGCNAARAASTGSGTDGTITTGATPAVSAGTGDCSATGGGATGTSGSVTTGTVVGRTAEASASAGAVVVVCGDDCNVLAGPGSWVAGASTGELEQPATMVAATVADTSTRQTPVTAHTVTSGTDVAHMRNRRRDVPPRKVTTQ